MMKEELCWHLIDILSNVFFSQITFWFCSSFLHTKVWVLNYLKCTKIKPKWNNRQIIISSRLLFSCFSDQLYETRCISKSFWPRLSYWVSYWKNKSGNYVEWRVITISVLQWYFKSCYWISILSQRATRIYKGADVTTVQNWNVDTLRVLPMCLVPKNSATHF